MTVNEDALAVARVKASGAVILGKTSGELQRGVASLPGLPATVLPIGASPAGLPIGAQVIGPTFEDRTRFTSPSSSSATSAGSCLHHSTE